MKLVDAFIAHLVSIKALKKDKPNKLDPTAEVYYEAKSCRVEFDDIGILEISKGEDGVWMVITPYGREHLNEVVLDAGNLKKFKVMMLQPVDLKAFTK